MAQNITLLGASFADVPAVLLPKTGGGTAQFDDTTDANATASDIAQGKTAYVNGTKLTGTASGGGGGASNFVTGTFKGTTTGAAMDVNLAYTGTGYPIAVIVYPTGGQDGNSTFSGLVQRYSSAQYYSTKLNVSTVPDYSGSNTANNYVVQVRYKSSSSSATSYSTQNNASWSVAGGGNASSTQSVGVLTFKSNKIMSVYIASTSYGFAANIDYTYHVIYSA